MSSAITLEARRFDLIERFWTRIARLTRAEFLHQRPRREHGDHEGTETYKAHALAAYAQGIAWMARVGRPEAAARLAAERDTLQAERWPALPEPTDHRVVDEAVFWSLIPAPRSQAPTSLERLAALEEALARLEAAGIRRFASIHARWMRRLHHWNVWALAHAARGGCSDGAFEAFRTWLILQGDPALLLLAIDDPARAAAQVPPEPDLPEGNCLALIAELVLRREGVPLEGLSVDPARPKGREWTEAGFARDHPLLARHHAARGGA